MAGAGLAERIEAASLRSWPAIEEEPLGGWTLRFSEGFTGRANSVQAIGTADGSLEERVARCEAWYAERERPTLFRITPFSEAGLDDVLDGRGYERYNRTHVLHRGTAGLAPRRDDVELGEPGLHDWLRTYAQLSGWPAAPGPMSRIVDLVRARSCLAVLRERSPRRPVACGLAVLDEHLLGLFDLVVAPDRRRTGLGEELVRRLVAWGTAGGAAHVYLQVTEDNAPALALYRKLGFGNVYDYWYRRRPE